MLALNIETGEIEWQQTNIGLPVLTASSSLTWIRHQEGKTIVEFQGREMEIEDIGEGFSLLDSFPADDILLGRGTGIENVFFTLDLNSGELGTLQLSLPYQPNNWVDGGHVWGLFPLGDYQAVVLVDMETGGYQFSGLLLSGEFTFTSQKKILATTSDGVTRVYEMP